MPWKKALSAIAIIVATAVAEELTKPPIKKLYYPKNIEQLFVKFNSQKSKLKQ